MTSSATEKRQSDLSLVLIRPAKEIERQYLAGELSFESAQKLARANYEALWWQYMPNEAFEACERNQRKKARAA